MWKDAEDAFALYAPIDGQDAYNEVLRHVMRDPNVRLEEVPYNWTGPNDTSMKSWRVKVVGSEKSCDDYLDGKVAANDIDFLAKLCMQTDKRFIRDYLLTNNQHLIPQATKDKLLRNKNDEMAIKEALSFIPSAKNMESGFMKTAEFGAGIALGKMPVKDLVDYVCNNNFYHIQNRIILGGINRIVSNPFVKYMIRRCENHPAELQRIANTAIDETARNRAQDRLDTLDKRADQKNVLASDDQNELANGYRRGIRDALNNITSQPIITTLFDEYLLVKDTERCLELLAKITVPTKLAEIRDGNAPRVLRQLATQQLKNI